jgi:threonine/homoserine/homoserine lactone efflux protein
LEDWKIKISVLWLVWEFAAVTVPICEQYIPGLLEEAIAEITPEMLVFLAIIMLIAPVMAFLSLTLKDSINRWANIIMGIVFVALGLFGAISWVAEPSYIDYSAFVVLLGIVEVVVAALIVWYAWKSKQKA